MKRFICFLFLMIFACALSTAEEARLCVSQRILCDDDLASYVTNCDGILYVLFQSGLYKLDASGEKQLIASYSDLPVNITALLSDDCFVYVTTWEEDEGKLIRLTGKDGTYLNEPVLMIDQVSWMSMVNSALRHGFLYYSNMEEDRKDDASVVRVSLVDGSSGSVKIRGLTGFDVMNDGNILALTAESDWHDEEYEYTMQVVSFETGKQDEWLKIDGTEYSSRFLYDYLTDTVYFVGQREVCAAKQNGQPELTDITFSQDISSGCLFANGLVLACGATLNICSFHNDSNEQRISLTVCGPYAEDEFFIPFFEAHPETDIRTIDTFEDEEPEERFVKDVLTQNPDVDIYILHDLNLLNTIKSRGYYYDLSGTDGINEKISRMYEPFIHAFTDGDKVAVFPHPWYVFFTSINYNADLFDELNLVVPTTWDEFFDFCIEWKENYEDDNLDISVDPFEHDLNLVSLLASYDDEMTRAGIEADYQSDILLSVLKKYLRVKELYENDESYTGKPLFYDYDLHPTSDNTREYIAMPRTFIKDADPIYTPMEGDIYYFVVNPFSKHAQEAAECVAAARDKTRMNDPYIYADIPDLPLDNIYYEEGLRQYQDKLEMLEAGQKDAEDDPEKLLDINEQINRTKKEMEAYRENNRWWFTEEDMIPFREVVSYVYFNDFNPIRELYANDPDFFDKVDEESLPGFLQALNSKVKMIRMEKDYD